MEKQLIKQLAKQLESWFIQHKQCVIATSGGIDSMVLAFVANKVLHANAIIAHASSASVPSLDAQRVNLYAKNYQWNLQHIKTNEMKTDSYYNNPINRCYYCKCSLFTSLKTLKHGPIITGTNTDDLTDFRPGLIAAREHDVLQPYVELAINKNTIRLLAAYYGLNDLKDIPASPCLSSRVETGIRIVPEELFLIDKVENYIKQKLHTDVVRFRIRAQTMELELMPQVIETLSVSQEQNILKEIHAITKNKAQHKNIQLTAYKQGSAFIGSKTYEESYV